MKISLVQTFVAAGISCLLSLGFFQARSDINSLLLALGSGICFFITLTLAIAVSFESKRTKANVKALSILALIGFLASNLTFTFIDFSTSSYIITNGILLLLFLSIFSTIKKANV